MTTELQADVVAPAGIWNLDPVHSRVDFEVRYLAGTFKGEFHEIGAELTVEAERASLEGTATVASVDVKDENLSAHLQSPDFFDAERHPELRFAARDIRLDGDGKVSVDGELTIKGVTKPVAVTGTVTAPIADLRKRPHRPQTDHEDRPHRLRSRLEQSASQR
jgi:polyisoprenoid-binding protein YceI